MITLDLSILNQKGTPMFNSDTLANRPAAGIVGRIFIAIDAPFGIYRDTGSAWDQISGASTFSGSLATGQVAFGSATNTISGSNNLFWDAANARLGIGTNAPAYALDVRTTSGFIAASFKSQYTATGLIGTDNGGTWLGMGTDGFVNCFYVNNNENSLLFRANNTLVGRVFNNGNWLLGSGVIANGGQRLQVYGDTLLSGSGATSATSSLLVQNSSGTDLVRFRNDGSSVFTKDTGNNFTRDDASVVIQRLGDGPFIAGIGITSDGKLRFKGESAGFNFLSGSSQLLIQSFTITGFNNSGVILSSAVTNTSASNNGSASVFNTVSIINLTHSYNIFSLNSNITSVVTNGLSRGLYVNPTLSGTIDFRSIEWSNNTGWGLYGAGTALNYLGGTLGIKTTSPYAPSTFSLDVNGGLLVKNTAGTTAQITLINADPSLGGNNGFLVASVGGTSGASYVDFQGYYGTSIVGSTALRLNPAGGAVIVNSTTNSGEQFQVTGTLRVNGQTSGTASGNSGQHLIINCDGTTYKIALLNP